MAFWCFPSTTIGFPSPAAPRPKGPKRTHVPPRSEATKNATGGCQVAHFQNVTTSAKKWGEQWEQWEIQKHKTLKPAFSSSTSSTTSDFFQHLNGQMSWVDMARSKSRKKATAKMRFEGQVTGNVNFLDQTMTSKSKPKIPQYHLYGYVLQSRRFLPKSRNSKGHQMWWVMRSLLLDTSNSVPFNYSHLTLQVPKPQLLKPQASLLRRLYMPCKRNFAGAMWKRCRHRNLQHQFMPTPS